MNHFHTLLVILSSISLLIGQAWAHERPSRGLEKEETGSDRRVVDFGFQLPGELTYVIGIFEAQARTYDFSLREFRPPVIFITEIKEGISQEKLDDLRIIYFSDRVHDKGELSVYGVNSCGLWKRNDAKYKYVIVVDTSVDRSDFLSCSTFVFDKVLTEIGLRE